MEHSTKTRPSRQGVIAVTLALWAAAAWTAWLGWDQQYETAPDGTQTGPYEAWQVAGLVLSLAVPVIWAASRAGTAWTVLGTTVGLTATAFVDWSDDASGLFVVGVGMIAVGTGLATALTCALVTAVRGRRQGTRPDGQPGDGPRGWS